MKALLLLIITVVFTIGHLISPENFAYVLPDSDTPTVTPTESSKTAPTAVSEPTAASDTGTGTTIVPAATQTPDLETYGNTIIRENSDNYPETMFGSAKVEDNFERGSAGFGINAGLNDDDNTRIIAVNNRLSLEPKKNNGWINWRLRPPSVNDSAAEMEFSIITCARGDRTGIMMRAGDYTSGHGYYFSLSCEGTLSILRDTTVLNTADARSAFNNSSGDINVMTTIASGNTLTAILNGEQLLTVQDDVYTEGFNGFFTSPQGQNTLTMDILSYKEFYNEEVK